MASKGQRFNRYSPELKKEILDKYFSNQGSSKSLAKEYNFYQIKYGQQILHI